MTTSFIVRATCATLPLLALATLAPAARAQDSIDLIGTIEGESISLATGTLSHADQTVLTTLVSGVAKDVSLGTLSFQSVDSTPLSSRQIRLFADLLVNNAVPVTDEFFYDANFSSDEATTSVGFSSSSQTYVMPGGGSLLVSVTGISPVKVSGSTASTPMTATFLYTAPSASAAAPEPGTIALLLSAGIPVVGLVRRRKATR